jgi:aspartate/methionine/tyrosine aminotransferase
VKIRPFQLERYFARYEFEVPFLLCASDCESRSIGGLLALEPGSEARFRSHWLGYTESEGSLALRAEIAGLYDTIAPAQVLVHTGAEEAIFVFMHAVLEAGDHVLVHWPCYQSLMEVARSLGCEVTPWVARAEAGWALSVGELEGLIRPQTRLIILNTPHNPTGYLMSPADFQALNDLARERGLLLFSDEVYRGLEHRPEDRLPAACDLGDHAVSLGVMSKTYGLAGLRIGWIATHNREIYARVAAVKDYTTICNSAPSEFLAELALRHREVLVARNLGLIRRNLSALDAFFERHEDVFAWQRPQAGPIAFPGLLVGDVDVFCRDLVQGAGVLLLPGTIYDHPGNHFRIGFGRADMPQALARLERYLLGRET